MKTIAGRLRYVREKMGISQADASSKFGIPVSTYRKYETGPSEPGSDAIARISRAGINANWLLTGEGAMLLSDVPLRPALPKILDVYKAEAPTRHLRVAEMEAHYHSRDPATLRMAITLAEEASAVQAFSLDQRVEMILSFYNRLSKKPDQ